MNRNCIGGPLKRFRKSAEIRSFIFSLWTRYGIWRSYGVGWQRCEGYRLVLDRASGPDMRSFCPAPIETRKALASGHQQHTSPYNGTHSSLSLIHLIIFLTTLCIYILQKRIPFLLHYPALVPSLVSFRSHFVLVFIFC